MWNVRSLSLLVDAVGTRAEEGIPSWTPVWSKSTTRLWLPPTIKFQRLPAMSLPVVAVSPARKRLRVCVEWLGKVQCREDSRPDLSHCHEATKEELAAMVASIANIAKRYDYFRARDRDGTTAEQPNLPSFLGTVIQPKESLEAATGFSGSVIGDLSYRDQKSAKRLRAWSRILSIVIDFQK